MLKGKYTSNYYIKAEWSKTHELKNKDLQN